MVEHPDRVDQLTALVDGQPIADDDQPGTSGRLRRLCVTVTQVLPATWAGLSLAEDGKVSGALTGSDAHARELEGLQFTFGEGPCVDSVRTRRPVMEPDLAVVGRPALAGIRPGRSPAGDPRRVCVPAAGRGGLPRRARRLPRPGRTRVAGHDRRRADLRRHRPDHAGGRRPAVGPRRRRRVAGRPAHARDGGLPGAGHGDGRPGREPRRCPGEAPGVRLRRRDDPWPRWPATSWPAACGWIPSCRVRPSRDTLGEPEGSPA